MRKKERFEIGAYGVSGKIGWFMSDNIPNVGDKLTVDSKSGSGVIHGTVKNVEFDPWRKDLVCVDIR